MKHNPYISPQSKLETVSPVKLPIELLSNIRNAWLASLIIGLIAFAQFGYYVFNKSMVSTYVIEFGASILLLFVLSSVLFFRKFIPSVIFLILFCAMKLWDYMVGGSLQGVGGVLIILFFSIKGITSIYKLNLLE
jgi:hypothetical protein